ENQRLDPYLEPRGEGGHVGVAQEDVETAKAFRVGVRLIAGIDDGPTLHRIDALQFAEKIAPLRDLEAGRNEFVLGLDGKLAGAGKNLARDQKRLNSLRQRFPGERTREQVIFMAAVAVAVEVRVVFVEPDADAALFGEMSRAGHQDALAGAVVGDQFLKGSALRRAILGMRMVGVK